MTYNLNGNKSIRTDPEIREMVEFADKHFKQLLYICQEFQKHMKMRRETRATKKKNQMNILVLSNILLRTKALLEEKSSESTTEK